MHDFYATHFIVLHTERHAEIRGDGQIYAARWPNIDPDIVPLSGPDR